MASSVTQLLLGREDETMRGDHGMPLILNAEDVFLPFQQQGMKVTEESPSEASLLRTAMGRAPIRIGIDPFAYGLMGALCVDPCFPTVTPSGLH